jgi:RNA polymerase-binding transcription factor DksA
MDTPHFHAKLEEELLRVTADLNTLGVHNPDNPDDWVATPEDNMDEGEADPDLVADRVEGLEERVSTLALLETEYNNIRRALRKIESGSYGTCEVCGNAIENERLEALPAARTCIAHREQELGLLD